MQALTPAMEGWRKRIGRIAANFEAANKVPPPSSAPTQAQPRAQAGSSAPQAPQQVCIGCTQEVPGPMRQATSCVLICSTCLLGIVAGQPGKTCNPLVHGLS